MKAEYDIKPVAVDGLADLVNQLTQELSDSRRRLAAAQQKLGTTGRSLEVRTQELTEARAALSLLLATLDSTTDGIIALGYFGRAMHFNARFVDIWRIPQEKLPGLNDGAMLAMQLSQVKDPEGFLAEIEAQKAHPEEPRCCRVELCDGRVLEWHVAPQRVRGKRVGCVTSWRDVTDRERLARMVTALEAQMPREVAEARATVW